MIQATSWPAAKQIKYCTSQDQDDDVRAVAASALLPLAPVLAAADQPQQAAALQASLWNILLDSDELSPATGDLASRLTSHSHF